MPGPGSRVSGDSATLVSDDLKNAYNDRWSEGVSASLRHLLGGTDLGESEVFWHPLGFFRMHLGSDSSGLRYFLHCWPRGYRSTQEPAWMIHRHAWDLESYIVAGSLTDTEYRVVRAKSAALVCISGPLYEASVTDEQSVMANTEQYLDLVVEQSSSHVTGDFYRVDIGSFHQTTVPLSDACVTLARVGPRLRERSQILGDSDGPRTLTYSRVRVEREFVQAALSSAIGPTANPAAP